MNGANADLRKDMKEMDKLFRQGRGDLREWSPEVLDMIDKMFLKNYAHKDYGFQMELFFPDSQDNYTRFRQYCDGVDQILRENASGAPPYAREYFAYYSIWEMRGYRFPVPLGTASVIAAVDAIAANVRKGLVEVSNITYRPTLCSFGISKSLYSHCLIPRMQDDRIRGACHSIFSLFHPAFAR